MGGSKDREEEAWRVYGVMVEAVVLMAHGFQRRKQRRRGVMERKIENE